MSERPTQAVYDRALLLIYLGEIVIRERRELEKKCSYPEDYGNDKTLLVRMQQVLLRDCVQDEIKRLLKSRGIKSVIEKQG